MKIAIVGGMNFDQPALDGFLFKLFEKYPDATIVTGEGKGAEKHAYDSAKTLNFTTEKKVVTEQHEAWYGDEAMDCQVAEILCECDIIVTVGNGGRVKIATDWWHRMNMHARDPRGALLKKDDKYISRREPGNEILLHHIPAPPSTRAKTAAPKRAKKKQEQLAA